MDFNPGQPKGDSAGDNQPRESSPQPEKPTASVQPMSSSPTQAAYPPPPNQEPLPQPASPQAVSLQVEQPIQPIQPSSNIIETDSVPEVRKKK